MEKIVSGRTIEEAVENACTELNISKDDFTYEVVDMEKKGFLGIGTKPAKIKVVYQVSPVAYISDYLKGLFQILGVTEYTEKIDILEDNVINIQLDGEGLNQYTLRYTDIVEPVQFLLVMTLNKQLKEHYKVTFNINDYKEKSVARLEALAVKTANQVSRSRRKATLYPMSAYQRRIIHAKLQSFKNITTYSIGEEPNRKVVVAFQNENGRDGGAARPPRRENGGNRGSGRKPSGDRPSYHNNRDNRPRNNTPRPAATTTGEPFKLKQIYPKPAEDKKTKDE